MAFLVLAILLIEQLVFSLAAALAALVLGATAIMRHCPLYELFHHSSGAHPSHPQQH